MAERFYGTHFAMYEAGETGICHPASVGLALLKKEHQKPHRYTTKALSENKI